MNKTKILDMKLLSVDWKNYNARSNLFGHSTDLKGKHLRNVFTLLDVFQTQMKI